VLESLSAFLLIKSNNGNSSLDGSHLGDEAFSRVSLIGIEDKSISSREASLKQTKCKSGTVPIKFFERPVDALRVKTHAIIFWLGSNGSLVEASNGAFGELGVSLGD